MINLNKLLASKRVVVKYADINVDKNFVKKFRIGNNLTQVALANIVGVSKKTVEKWEQGANKVNGSSAVLLTLLNNNPELINQLYSVKKAVEGTAEDDFKQIDSKEITMPVKSTIFKVMNPIAAMF